MRKCNDCGTTKPPKAWNGQRWMLDDVFEKDPSRYVWICADGISCVQRMKQKEAEVLEVLGGTAALN